MRLDELWQRQAHVAIVGERFDVSQCHQVHGILALCNGKFTASFELDDGAGGRDIRRALPGRGLA